MSIVVQFTEPEKHALVNRYMDQNTSLEYMLAYKLKIDNIIHKDYIKSYILNQYITVENVLLFVVESSKMVFPNIFLNMYFTA